mmetsp:Transcript_45515/g.131850  ORF Transcript_45515/g.131850 Transcript_45515/m.131850 type:complete len:154 (-) Transcript_45515:471-932(-)
MGGMKPDQSSDSSTTFLDQEIASIGGRSSEPPHEDDQGGQQAHKQCLRPCLTDSDWWLEWESFNGFLDVGDEAHPRLHQFVNRHCAVEIARGWVFFDRSPLGDGERDTSQTSFSDEQQADGGKDASLQTSFSAERQADVGKDASRKVRQICSL